MTVATVYTIFTKLKTCKTCKFTLTHNKSLLGKIWKKKLVESRPTIRPLWAYIVKNKKDVQLHGGTGTLKSHLTDNGQLCFARALSVPCIAMEQEVVHQQFLVEILHIAFCRSFSIPCIKIQNVGWWHGKMRNKQTRQCTTNEVHNRSQGRWLTDAWLNVGWLSVIKPTITISTPCY